ncbi:MAG: ribonuclease HII [Solobacterium sp.]|nr:ribonuclease HII [Solobacterium sp.]
MKKNRKVCDNEYEHRAWSEGKLLLGIDEAGRGPLAGPLTVAGVIFPIGYENEEIYDSKALSEKKREELFEVIQRDALYYEIINVSPEEIDRYNIYRADQRAFAAIAGHLHADVVLTDAMPIPGTDAIAIVKGDQKSISIAAGSILAKVTRDRIMAEYDRKYPQYGFARNKGYPTKAHLQAIEDYGITEIHRRSYGPVAAKQLSLDLFGEENS